MENLTFEERARLQKAITSLLKIECTSVLKVSPLEYSLDHNGIVQIMGKAVKSPAYPILVYNSYTLLVPDAADRIRKDLVSFEKWLDDAKKKVMDAMDLSRAALIKELLEL